MAIESFVRGFVSECRGRAFVALGGALVVFGCSCERNREGSRVDTSDDIGRERAALYAVQPDQSIIPSGENRLAVGGSYACMILGTGDLKCWGINDHYQLGLGLAPTDNRGDQPGELGSSAPPVDVGTDARPRSVATAVFQACVLLTDSTVKCWGTNDYGALGLDSNVSSVGAQPSDMGDNLQRAHLARPVRSLVAGRYHFCALLDDGDVSCWGRNDKGQLGVGDTVPRGTSTSPGQSVATSRVDLGGGRTAVAIAAGGSQSCAILDNGRVKCWGWNGGQDDTNVAGTGQLGAGDANPRGDGPNEMGDALPYVALPSGRTAVSLAVGYVHACAHLDDGSVRCWGDNSFGQLGTGNTTPCGANGTQCLGSQLVAVDLGPGRTARSIVAGADHTCAILDDGSLKCWGNNGYGQLGIESTSPQGDTPATLGSNMRAVSLGTLRSARSVAANWRNTCAWLDDGSVKCWGINDTGQLGLGTVNVHGTAPNTMGDNLPAIQLRESLSSGGTAQHNCRVFDDGSVKCWGNNAYGQLGVGDTTNRGTLSTQMGTALPKVLLPAGRRALSVVTGSSGSPSTGGHSCALLDDGSVWCWGASYWGQLCRGNQNGSWTPVPIALGTHQDGTAYKATFIAAGQETNCAVLDDGKMKCWGQNSNYQLGNGTTNSYGDGLTNGVPETCDHAPFVNVSSDPTVKVKSVVVGALHACALLTNGTVKCWGQNQFGQIGLGSTTPNQTSPGNPVALRTGDVAAGITAAGYHTCALLTTGVAECWGRNDTGQLGIDGVGNVGLSSTTVGDNFKRVKLDLDPTVTPPTPAPIQALAAGLNHTCALLDGGSIKCWGAEGLGAVGGSASGGNWVVGDAANEMATLVPVQLGVGLSPVSISAGMYGACALLSDGSEKCWGKNDLGQLGLGDTTNRGIGPSTMGDALPAIKLGVNRAALSIASGDSFSCAIVENGPVKCWGKNLSGQLGLGDTVSRGRSPSDLGDLENVVRLGTGRSARMIAAGQSHVCALLDNGLVKCWGDNASGQLGVGDTNARGDGPNEMNDYLSRVPLGTKVGTERTAVSITAGDAHTCALLDDNRVKCWGSNATGQLGIESAVSSLGVALDQLGDKEPAVSFGPGRTARAIAADGNATCALLDDASVKCWGDNAHGELGIGTTANHGAAKDTMGLSLPSVRLGTWAPPGLAPLADGGIRTAPNTAMLVGPSCAVLQSGKLKCWGDNSLGQLGLGITDSPRGDDPNELGNALASVRLDTADARTVVALSARKDHKCAILDDGSIKCWGGNALGQLGYGDTTNRGASATQLGDALQAISLGAGRKATRVAVGPSHTCALLDDGRVKCWGDNAQGELGAGSTAPSIGSAGGTDPNGAQFQMGDTLVAVATGARNECDNSACNASGSCTTPAGIDDNSACTTDSCTPATGVLHTPVSCAAAVAPFTVTAATPIVVAQDVFTPWPASIPNAQTLANLTYTPGGSNWMIGAVNGPTVTHDLWGLWASLTYLKEGLKRLTGQSLSVQTTNDLSTGIVLTTVAAASPDIRAYAGYLDNDGTDDFNANEAYYIRTEAQRTIVLANTVDGLTHGVSELLRGDHAVQPGVPGYEVLAMGPAWAYAPINLPSSLAFDEEYSSRPGFYIRTFTIPMSVNFGGPHGLLNGSQAGTIDSSVHLLPGQDVPQDETVEPSYARWLIGTDTWGSSVPPIPGHALQAYHTDVIKHLKYGYNDPNGQPANAEGFLANTCVGPDALHASLPPTCSGSYAVYVASDVAPLRAYVRTAGGGWGRHDGTGSSPTNPDGALSLDGTAWLDVSVPFVREIVRDKMFSKFDTDLQAAPDQISVFGTDAEDGGLLDQYYTQFVSAAHLDWWPEYREAEGLDVGAYALNNFFPGTPPATPLPAQPTETWWHANASNPDVINSQSDNIFAANNWLLHEWDKHVCRGGPDEPCDTTSTGKSKKDMVRTGLYSYSRHDVPPNFNLDPRIYVSVSSAGTLGHRGTGKWARASSVIAVSSAFQRLLPNAPGSVYGYLTNAYYTDVNTQGIGGSRQASAIQAGINYQYQSGYRSSTLESDFDFGKHGLDYYLYPKALWAPTQGNAALVATRTRWVSRAFCGADPSAPSLPSSPNGLCAAGEKMKQYYDFMAKPNLNRPALWATAIKMIDDAQTAFSASPNSSDPWIQRRLDDVKQYWYYYYLTRTTAPSADRFKEFVWKGQMSYTTAMEMVMRRIFGAYDPRDANDQPFSGCASSFTCPYCGTGFGDTCNPHANTYTPLRAHYTHDEVDGVALLDGGVSGGWWPLVRGYWNLANFHLFEDSTLSNGTSGAAVDQNDLVQVAEFSQSKCNADPSLPAIPNPAGPSQCQTEPFEINYQGISLSDNYGDITVYQTANAGDTIGVAVYRDAAGPSELTYTISRWNKSDDPTQSAWEVLPVDQNGNTAPLQTACRPSCVPANSSATRSIFIVSHQADVAGTYRITVALGTATTIAFTVPLEAVNQNDSTCSTGIRIMCPYSPHTPMVYSDAIWGEANPYPMWVYLPSPHWNANAGAFDDRWLDLEVLARISSYHTKVNLWSGTPGEGLTNIPQLSDAEADEVLDLPGEGLKHIKLNRYPTARFASFATREAPTGDPPTCVHQFCLPGGYYFVTPYFDSVPNYWATSPQHLVVPYSVACADGLHPVGRTCP